MSKSLKLENDNYLDSQSVTHNRELLSVVLETIKNSISDMKETVLYDNEAGSNDNITLSDSASNYKYLEILYRNNNNLFKSVKVYQPNGKNVNLDIVIGSANTMWIQSATRHINDNTITKVSNRGMQCNIKQISSMEIIEYLYIVRVIGYK